MFVHMRVACRYIWCNRVALARSVHDMEKQMYDNTKYSLIAWEPLSQLVGTMFSRTGATTSQVLTRFNRGNEEFFSTVALCLWKLANGANVPWGRAAVQPQVFEAVPRHEKVIPIFFVMIIS